MNQRRLVVLANKTPTDEGAVATWPPIGLDATRRRRIAKAPGLPIPSSLCLLRADEVIE